MSVEIRERDLEKGKVSLYLDIYADGKRTYQFLKLYPLKSPKTTKDRAERNEIYRKADAMRVKVESDLLNQNDIDKGFKKSQLLFLDYFKALHGDSDERDHLIPGQADHQFRGKLTRGFRDKLTTLNV